MIFKLFGKRDDKQPQVTPREYLGSLTGSPAAVLRLVLDWMEDQSAQGKLSLAEMQLANTRMEPVLAAIDVIVATQRRLGTGQKLLRSYCESFGHAYARIANALPAGHADRQLSFLRAAHLLSRACRLARTSHDDPVELRREIVTLFDNARQSGLATTRKVPYAGMQESSVAQEIAVTLLMETAPFDTLTLEQLEYLERFMVLHGRYIVLRTDPDPAVSHVAGSTGLVQPFDPANAADALLFVGPGSLAGKLADIARFDDNGALPQWAGTPLPDTDLKTLKSLAQRLLAAWERKHIQRGSDRLARQDSLRVTGGLHNIRRAVAYAAYVRGGGQLDAYGAQDQALREWVRAIKAGLESSVKKLTPVETLEAMEAIGDSTAVETWPVSDSSARGYNLAVPGYRAWLAVGGLLALRETSSIDWQVTFVRRLYGSGKTRRAGVEILHGTPRPVGIGSEGETTYTTIADLRDAILIAGETDIWLATDFNCTPGSVYLTVGGQGRQLLRIVERFWGNADYKIYTCKPVAA